MNTQCGTCGLSCSSLVWSPPCAHLWVGKCSLPSTPLSQERGKDLNWCVWTSLFLPCLCDWKQVPKNVGGPGVLESSSGSCTTPS